MPAGADFHERRRDRQRYRHVDCPSGKLGYKRRQHAEGDAARITKQGFGGGPGQRLFPYRCPHCGWWHLTKKPQKASQVGRTTVAA